jgi:ATP-dependent RNA helicase RhlE
LTFDTLGLRPESLRAIADQGYIDPTPVQAQAIPAILTGRDLLAGAQTGTGKTAAFVLPMLQTLHATRQTGRLKVRGLIVVPTRELALQVEESIRIYGAHRPVRSSAIYGGVRMDRQVRALRNGIEVVVATPGRLLDHVRQGTINLHHVEILVLDEADRMLDMGFIHDIKRILEQLPAERQSLLFSATFTPTIRRLAADLLREPMSIDVAPRNATAAPIRQVVHPVDRTQKRHLLSHMLRSERINQALVFTRTKRGANRLAEQLGKDGINAAAIHGNKSQSQRVRALTSFKKGQSQVLVATDIAARGLDIESLPHVVNYELPSVPEDYVHRIGRTGRAGLEGTAISLVAAEEQDLMHAIERLLKKPVEREVIEGFEPSESYRVMASAPARTKPKRSRDRKGPSGARQPQAGKSGDTWAGGRSNEGSEQRHEQGKRHHPGPRKQRHATATSAQRNQGPNGGGSSAGRPGTAQRPAAEGQAMPGESFSGNRSGGASRSDRGQSGPRAN